MPCKWREDIWRIFNCLNNTIFPHTVFFPFGEEGKAKGRITCGRCKHLFNGKFHHSFSTQLSLYNPLRSSEGKDRLLFLVLSHPVRIPKWHGTLHCPRMGEHCRIPDFSSVDDVILLIHKKSSNMENPDPTWCAKNWKPDIPQVNTWKYLITSVKASFLYPNHLTSF